MKHRILLWRIFLIILVGLVSSSQIVYADIDWSIIKQIDLNAQPLDIAASADGRLIFVLAEGEILVYSISENKVTNRIPIDRDFDRVTLSDKRNALIISSSSSKRLKMIRVDRIYKIDISGHPFKGPADAPLTIVSFNDYQ
jgi:hypothetical protein